jgi:hypothetical protein
MCDGMLAIRRAASGSTMSDVEHHGKRVFKQPTVAFRLLYYLLIIIASGVMIGILYVRSLLD